MQGCFIYPMPVVPRVILLAGSLCMIYPGALTDVIGLAVLVVLLTPQIIRSLRAKRASNDVQKS